MRRACGSDKKCPKPFLPPSRGQSSFELLIILSFITVIVTAYLATFSQEFFPVSALANAKIAAISVASASVKGSCLFYGLEHVSLQGVSQIGLSFRALSTGTPCASVSRSAISARLGDLPFPYTLNITHR